MQYKVDSYTLEYIEDEDKYYISFLDSVNKECKLEIEKDVFDIYINSKKAYTKIKNEASRYMEHSELTEEDIYSRASSIFETTEDKYFKNKEREKLSLALKTLTDTQYRRIELHIVEEITIRDLAKKENVQKSQIQKSLKLGMKKLKKILDK